MSSKTPIEGAVKADFEHIPLPPEGAPGEAEKAVGRPQEPDDIAILDFVDAAAMTAEVSLDHPFRWEERLIDKVILHMPSVSDIIRVYEKAPRDTDGDVKLIEFYAAIAGLPVKVLRAIPYDDYERIVAASSPFLPRALTANASS